MREADAKVSSPIKPRRPKSTEPRQVRFEPDLTFNAPETDHDTQPDSHPQVGLPYLNRPPPAQWFTAADPTRSIHCQPVWQHPPPPQPQLQPQLQPKIAYPLSLPMGDYQNSVPLPTGVNFQPPAPDTSFGPIPHVYVPRFDGGLAQQPVMALPQQAAYVPHQGYMPTQPVMLNGQAFMPLQHVQQPPPPPPPMMGMSGAAFVGAPPPTFVPGPHATVPDVSGLGKTPAEETLRQVEFAFNNRLFEPQDFKPADDDPSRFYYVREVDGNWTQRNRFTIDHMGDCRWYVTDEGWFYAVRLPD